MARAALDTALLDATLRPVRSPPRRAAGRVARAAAAPVAGDRGGGPPGVDRRPRGGRGRTGGRRRRAGELKVSPHPADLDAVTAVRATWPDLALAVDANGSLDNRSLSILAEQGLAYVEQPAPADDLVASAAMARASTCRWPSTSRSRRWPPSRSPSPWARAGSSTSSPPASAASRVAADLALAAADAGCGVFVGGMLETGIGRAAAVAVAALPACTLPTDLGPSERYVAVDLTDPIVVDEQACWWSPTAPASAWPSGPITSPRSPSSDWCWWRDGGGAVGDRPLLGLGRAVPRARGARTGPALGLVVRGGTPGGGPGQHPAARGGRRSRPRRRPGSRSSVAAAVAARSGWPRGGDVGRRDPPGR